MIRNIADYAARRIEKIVRQNEAMMIGVYIQKSDDKKYAVVHHFLTGDKEMLAKFVKDTMEGDENFKKIIKDACANIDDNFWTFSDWLNAYGYDNFVKDIVNEINVRKETKQ